jgi:hypothetical protein
MDFSVVTPCFNSIRWIELCVHSVRHACHGLSYEHLVCDGGSTDGTVEYLQQQKDIRLIPGPDQGMYDALNKGMAAARGRILGHLNVDEQYDRRGLTCALARLEKPGVDAVFGPTIMLDEHLRFLYLYNQFVRPLRVDAEYQMPVQTCSLLFHRKIWERFPYPAEFRMAGDHVWVRRQFHLGWKLIPQKQAIGIFTWHPDQLAPRHIGGKRENPTPDVDRKSLPMKAAKLGYQIRNFLSGATIPPGRLSYQVMTDSGHIEMRTECWPRLKMPRGEKRRLASSRH